MKKVLIPSLLSLAFSGCIALPISNSDKLTPEQKLEFSEVANDLVGDYVVVDSRKDDMKMAAMSVKRKDNDLLFIVNQKNGENFLVTGKDCRGYRRNSWRSVMCDKIPEGLNYISFDLMDQPREIKDGAILLPFAPMKVNSGDYLIDFARRGGRSNYYVLKKRAATN